MPLESLLARVENDLSRGDLRMARQRLWSGAADYPSDQRLWDKLIAICTEQGDRQSAGEALFFSLREDDAARALRDHFVRTLGDDRERLLHEFRFKTHIVRGAPPEVRQRFDELFGTADWLPPPIAQTDGRGIGIGCGLIMLVVGALIVKGCMAFVGEGVRWCAG